MLDYADLAEYVDRAKAQDECAFTHLYEKTCLMVYNVACTLLQDEEEAKDIVSEVYIRVWKHLASLHDNRSFIRWLIVITQRVCQDHKTKWQQFPDSIEAATELEEPNDLIADWQQKETLRSLMQSLIRHLPENQQRAIYCVYFKQLSVAQTAALEDCSINTILSRLYYARNTLRKAILEEEKRTGDKYHLPVAAAALSALMVLPQVCFTLSPEEAAKILFSVFTALGIQYTGEKAPPVVTFITEDDLGKHRSVLIKLKPVFLGVLAVAGLLIAMLLLGLGYTHGKRSHPPELPTTTPTTVTAPVSTSEEPASTKAVDSSIDPSTTASPSTETIPTTTVEPIITTAPTTTAAPSGPQTASVNYVTYTYTVDNGTATITAAQLNENANTSAMETLIIPAKLDGWPVTTIGPYAFSSNDTIQSLVLQKPLIEIGPYAFTCCSNLTSIQFAPSLQKIADYAFSTCKALNNFSLPEGLTYIGANAFSTCLALTAITFPDSLTYIGENALYNNAQITQLHLPAQVKIDVSDNAAPAFAAMPALREITVDANNQQLCAVDGVLYTKSKQVLLVYPNDKPGATFTLPESVSRIGQSAFSSRHLTSLTFSENLIAIDNYAINNCTEITSIHIPAFVTTIRPHALSAPKLTEITVSENNPQFCSIDGILYSKDKTKMFRYPAAKPGTSFTIPDSVTTLMYSSMRGAKLQSLSMSDSVTSIQQFSLAEMSELTSIRLSDNITHLPAHVLAYNPNITEYLMPKQLKIIDENAFQGCSRLTCVRFQGNAISYNGSTVIALSNKACVFAYPRNATGWSATYWRNHYALIAYDLQTPDETTASITTTTAAPETTDVPVTTTAPETTAVPETTAAPETIAVPEPEGEQIQVIGNTTYTYIVEDGNATITKVHFFDEHEMQAVILPAALNGWPVIAIGSYVFQAANSLQSIVFPATIETIGSYAFYSCKKLTHVEFPQNLRKIGESAFAFCEALTGIHLPEGLEAIDEMAFQHCYALTEIKLPDSLTYLGAYVLEFNDKITTIHLPAKVKLDTGLDANLALSRMGGLQKITVDPANDTICAVDGVLYTKDMKVLLTYPEDKPGTSFTIPATVTRLGRYSMGSKHLTSITIPDTVARFDSFCFTRCQEITTLTIPRALNLISTCSLNAPKLTSFQVSPENSFFNAIDGVLYRMSDMVLVQYPIAKPDSSFVIPDKVKTVRNYAFDGAAYLTELSMSDSVTTIGMYSFSNMPNLTSLRLSDSINELPAFSLEDNDKITEYVMPQNLTKIDKAALQSCEKLERVVFQSNAISYQVSEKISLSNKSCVFAYPRNATGWTDAYWINNYNMQPYDPPEAEETAPPMTQESTSYDNLTFDIEFDHIVITGCSNDASELHIPSSIQGYPVTRIAPEAFSENTKLISVELPEGLKSIGRYAFNMCENLQKINFPSTLSSIESRAFYGCALETLSFPESELNLGVYAFGSCNQLQSIHLPAGITFSTSEFSAQPFTNLSRLQSFTVSPNNPNFCAEDGVLFTKNKELLICYPQKKIGSTYVIPDGVKTLGMHAFYSSNLSAVSIPDSVTVMYDFCFLKNTGLTELTLPANLTRIGNCALNGLNITSFAISADNPFFSVQDGILFNKKQTFLYAYPPAKPGSEYIVADTVFKLMRGVFYYNQNLIHISIPQSVVYVETDCFRYAQNLRSIHFYNALNTFEGRMFQGCLHLEELKFAGGVPNHNNLSLFKPSPSLIIYYPRSHPEWETSWANKYTLVPYDIP